MKRVLVTGANGFVGEATCRHLLSRGWAVRGAVRSAGSAAPQGAETVVVGDIDGETDWNSALDGIESVVHCAARVHVLKEHATDPLAAFRRVNVEASRQLAEQAVEAGVGRFVFLSSIGAALAAAAARASPYQQSKLEAEIALQEIAEHSEMILVILRPPLIYGPGAPGNFHRLAAAVAAGRLLPLASLDNQRAALYVGNLTLAVEAALGCSASPVAALELCDAETLSTAELARRIGHASGRPARLFPVPPALLRLAGGLLGYRAAVDSLTETLTIDNSAIRQSLGWSPVVSVDEGLAATFAGPHMRDPL